MGSGIMVKVTELLDDYERYVGFLRSNEEALEVYALVVLTTRDALDEHWNELSEEQRKRVLAGDVRLARKHRNVAVVLPSLHAHDRRRWWWFLHEGPKVRKQVRAVEKA